VVDLLVASGYLAVPHARERPDDGFPSHKLPKKNRSLYQSADEPAAASSTEVSL